MINRREFVTATAAVAVAGATVATAPAAAASPATAAASAADGAVTITAGHLSIGLSDTGRVTGLVDVRDGTDHLAADRSVPLVSVVVDGEQDAPTRLRVSAQDPNTLVFTSAKATIRVKVKHHPSYTTLEVTGLSPSPGTDVATLLWGPLPTSVTHTVGEGVGVVRDDRFAFGMHPLNDKTVGAWPSEYNAYGFGSDVISKPYGQGGTQTEWSTAAKTPWGSILRAFTYDYSKVRIRDGQIPVGPLAGAEGRIVGSKLALFGTTPDMVLSVRSIIAQDQHLPYPTIDGQWQKTAEATRRPFLTMGDLSVDNLAAAVQFAVQAGIKNIYSQQNAVGPWASTGHYRFNSNFGGSDAAAAQMVATAAKSGVRVGVHTIATFISSNDRYITPAPADRRITVGKTVHLTRALAAADTTLYADGDSGGGGHVFGTRLRIGDEFVTYSEVSRISDSEWQFTGVKRAQWSSTARSYAVGADATRIVENEYGGATGDLPVIDEIATRLATAYNTTGIRNTSYDGLEAAPWSGWGGHGGAHLINGVHRQLKDTDGFVSEASNLISNSWDAQSRVSWGGIGWSDSNYEQVAKNNNFYAANYIPAMGGSLPLSGNDTELKTETTLARVASLDAIFGWFETSVNGLSKGSNTAAVLSAVKRWNAAITAHAFTADQRKAMADQSTYWHLSEVTAGKEWSLQQLDADGTAVGGPQSVVAPKPGFSSGAPANARAGELYQFKVTSRTAQTTRYEITSGSLPDGLALNKDTGGITGIPTRPGSATFTVTARNSGDLPDAAATYRMTVASPRT